MEIVFLGKQQGIGVGLCQFGLFILFSAKPYRPDRMNDITRRQTIAFGYFGFACAATAQSAALVQQLFARGAVYRTVYAATAQQR
ncbi:Uncharacterised protein [Mycobacteroides abscessus subsp. massiliense]|nr:Uncharacterised protein [Mycobacteroides abscessus subsp. massiliense]